MLLLSLLISHVLSSSLALNDAGDCNNAEDWHLEGVTNSCIKWVHGAKVKASEALAACVALDSRASLVVIQTLEKRASIVSLIDTDAAVSADTEFMTAGVGSDPFEKGNYGAASWAMVDKTLDPFGVHQKVYTNPGTTLGTTEAHWSSDPKEFKKDGVVTWTYGSDSADGNLKMRFGPSDNLYDYICEVCKTDDISTCGSVAQIIEKAGEDLPNLGEADFPASCPAGQELKGVDTLICENCKCWGAGQATKQLKLDDEGKVLAHEPYSRKECKKKAIAEGYPIFSYLPLGFKSACVFGKEYSNSMACDETKLRRTSLDSSRPWVMMAVEKKCIQTCTAEPTEIQEGKKCNTLGEVRYHKQKTRLLNIMDCAQAAYNHGREYFSWHRSKRWCYFGRDKSGADECHPDNAYTTYEEGVTAKIVIGKNAETGEDILGENQHAKDWVIAKAECETPVAKWVIADVGKNCDETCANSNLECDDDDFKAQLGDVDTPAEFRTVIDDAASPALAAEFVTYPPAECDEGDADAVPNFVVREQVCFFSKQGRQNDVKCDALPTDSNNVGKQRVCWCSVKAP